MRLWRPQLALESQHPTTGSPRRGHSTISPPPLPPPEPPTGPANESPRALAAPDRLWARGSFRLWVSEDSGTRRIVRVDAPYALVGRLPGVDVRIPDRDVSARHVYLHLDRRGLFAVDLATRTGTRFDGLPRPAAWLRAGSVMEIASRRIEVIDFETDELAPTTDQPGLEPPPDLLSDADPEALVRVTLVPGQAPWEPRALGSALVFLGRSGSCGVRIPEPTVARIHAVLIRTVDAAYIVDLMGQATWINGRRIRGASALRDGDGLMIGSAQFTVRISGPGSATHGIATRTPLPEPPVELRAIPFPAVTAAWPGALEQVFPAPPAGLAPEAQAAVLAWIVQVVHAGQADALRRQGEFHDALAQMVRQICLDNANLMSEHVQRMERINQELASLREEIRQRLGPTTPATAAPPGTPALPPQPVPITAPASPSQPPLRVPQPEAAPASTAQSTDWLLRRVHQLEEENRSTWRDLLSRLGGTRPRS